MQGFQVVMNFLVMPLFFLSGALFPLAGLPRAMAVVTRLDPLAYGIDGLRGALINTSYIGSGTDLVALCGFAVTFLVLGARLFSRIQV
jgi:ABC-2 type transport system permease protein